MKFYVIYSVDCADKNLSPSIERWKPRKSLLKKLSKTEGNSEYQYDYLEGIWSEGSHFKYAGLLTKDEFKELLCDGELVFEDINTMGSLTDLGWLPAFAFNTQSIYGNVIGSCYVTPMPDVPSPLHDWTNEEIEGLPKDFKEILMEQIGEIQERNWNRIKRVFKAGC